MLTAIRRLIRSDDSTPSHGVWESTTNLIANGAAVLDPESGWCELRVPGKALFGGGGSGGGEATVTLGPVNTISAGTGKRPTATSVLDDGELRRAAREYVEQGYTVSPTVLTGADAHRFFALCDELRSRGRMVGVLTRPIRVGVRVRRLPAGSECELVASWTDGRSLLRDRGRGREFVVSHEQHYLRWLWDEPATAASSGC